MGLSLVPHDSKVGSQAKSGGPTSVAWYFLNTPQSIFYLWRIYLCNFTSCFLKIVKILLFVKKQIRMKKERL
jgi:hypothetical protein